MKKSKLWIPLLTISGAAAVVAPVMTSCSQSEKEEVHFKFDSPSKEDQTNNTVDSSYFTFSTADELTEEQAKNIQFIAIPKTKTSSMSIVRCYVSDIYDNRTKFDVQLDFSIEPSALTTEGTKLEYDIKIRNGTWYQLETGFSMLAKKK